jgi:hypothetical protein
MPKRPRLTAPGIPWKFIQHGHNREACFYDNTTNFNCYTQALLINTAGKF